MNELKDRVALITGGAAGIGLAAARAFLGAGARVVITGRRRSALDAVVADQRNMAAVVADVGNPPDVRRTIESAVARWGRLDVLVNNAGAGLPMSLSETTVERINAVLAVNVVGPSLLTAAAVPHLEATGGSIINISSTLGRKPAAGFAHYAAGKAALEQLTRCWALELAPRGVRVNAVAPGPVETSFLRERMGLSDEAAEAVEAEERRTIPLGRRGEPHDIASWVVALAAPGAAWVTGQVFRIDGGFSLV